MSWVCPAPQSTPPHTWNTTVNKEVYVVRTVQHIVQYLFRRDIVVSVYHQTFSKAGATSEHCFVPLASSHIDPCVTPHPPVSPPPFKTNSYYNYPQRPAKTKQRQKQTKNMKEESNVCVVHLLPSLRQSRGQKGWGGGYSLNEHTMTRRHSLNRLLRRADHRLAPPHRGHGFVPTDEASTSQKREGHVQRNGVVSMIRKDQREAPIRLPAVRSYMNDFAEILVLPS